jgi:hypothetical protein
MTTFEQSDNLESLQTELADEIDASNTCVANGKGSYGEGGTCHATTGILHELRIARLERMIKAEKKRLKAEEKRLKRLECPAPKAAGTQAKLDAILAAVAPSGSGSYELGEGEG